MKDEDRAVFLLRDEIPKRSKSDFLYDLLAFFPEGISYETPANFRHYLAAD